MPEKAQHLNDINVYPRGRGSNNLSVQECREGLQCARESGSTLVASCQN